MAVFARMRELLILLIHVLVSFAKLLRQAARAQSPQNLFC